MIVTDARSYNAVLGNSWLKKAKARIDLDAQRLIFTNHGRKFCVPLDIQKGVVPKLTQRPEDEESEEEDEMTPGEAHLNVAEEEANVVIHEEYRHLNRREKNQLIEYNMRNTECPFCGERIYCAEMMCTCSDTKVIPFLDTLEQHLLEECKIKKPRMQQL
jgi:hypothetical protein